MLLPKVQVKIHSASCKTGRTAHTHLHHQIRAKHPLESVLTTDTSMNFVRAFELYERRWDIEVIFKECRGYLGLGKCQSRSYNAQIADTTLCFMMYQMLSLAKRFSEYEALGALFRSERDRLQVLTLWSRTLEEVRHLLEVLSHEAGVDLLTCLSTVAARQMADFLLLK